MQIAPETNMHQTIVQNNGTKLNNFRTNNFDLLRIFAATQVLFQHALLHLQLPDEPWWKVLSKVPGVPVFFVISGFLISASFEKTHSLKVYIQNRLLRILPGLWVCVILTAIIVTALGYHFFPSGLIWLPLQLVGLIYTPGFLADFGFHSYNGSLWTIPVELQFYFMLPVVYYVSRRVFKKQSVFVYSFILFAVIGALLLYFFKNDALMGDGAVSGITKIIQYTFFQFFYMFLLGVLFYKYKIYAHKLIKGKGLLWILVYATFVYFSVLPPVLNYIVSQVLLGITAISCAYTLPGTSKKIIKNDISYGVYIYHGLVLNLFVQYGYTGKWSYLAYLIIITYFIAFLSWVLVEKPFIKRKKTTLKEG